MDEGRISLDDPVSDFGVELAGKIRAQRAAEYSTVAKATVLAR